MAEKAEKEQYEFTLKLNNFLEKVTSNMHKYNNILRSDLDNKSLCRLQEQILTEAFKLLSDYSKDLKPTYEKLNNLELQFSFWLLTNIKSIQHIPEQPNL